MKYKVGDRVKIKENLSENLYLGMRMAKWQGEVMTIRAVERGNYYKMLEDMDEFFENHTPGWIWYEDMIEGLAEDTIKDSGNRRIFESGAERDIQEGKGRCDLLPACAILRLAKHYEAGAKKYSERNWEKGIPIHSFIDSAIRHILRYLEGQTDEDHLCAAAWNLLGAMWTEEKHPELQDIPARLEGKNE